MRPYTRAWSYITLCRHAHTWLNACIPCTLRIRMDAHKNTYTHLHLCIHVCTYMARNRIFLHASMHVCMCVTSHIYIYIYACMYEYVHVCATRICVDSCVCICSYAYSYTSVGHYAALCFLDCFVFPYVLGWSWHYEALCCFMPE